MSSRVFGNRPDCAYYLLLGLCVAAMFTAFGGIFTYIGFWPQVVFHHHHQHQQQQQQHDPTHRQSSFYEYGVSEKSIEIYSIMGPIFLVIGVGIALLVGVLAIKYDCEYEPEEPKIAILRLASEMSLNLSHGDSKYELMSTIPTASCPNNSCTHPDNYYNNCRAETSKNHVAHSSTTVPGASSSLPIV